MKIPRLWLLVLTALLVGISFLSLATPKPTIAQTTPIQPGAGNTAAITLALNSPLVQSAQKFIVTEAKQIQDSNLRTATLDGINNPQACIYHRIGVDDTKKQTILNNLLAAGLVNSSDASSIPGGLTAGVFPPVLEDGTTCPKLPQRFFSAPGSAFSSHHSYPGGLVVHEALNDLSDLSLASNYRLVYGQSLPNGLPFVNGSGNPTQYQNTADFYINNDIIIAAPLWHDWAKPIVFQWNADGTEFLELNFGGNGQTDNNGGAGDSRTGGHHIISLAETMKRGLAPDFVIAQASAHVAPTLGNEYKVVNWLRAAAILAQIDPVTTGYLYKDKQNNFRLPPLRRLGDIDLNANGQTNLLVEYPLHNLSDADFVESIPAVTIDQVLLRAIAPQFGYDPTNTTTYNTKFRNPVLSYFSAERLIIIYGNSGLNGVVAEVNKLRQLNII